MRKLILTFLLLFSFVPGQQDVGIFSDAITLYRKNNFPEAQILFLKIYNSGKSGNDLKSTSLFYAGKCYFNMKMPDAGIESFEKLSRQFPNSSYNEPVLYELAKTYFERKEYDKSVFSSEKFIRIYPFSFQAPEVSYYLGKSYERLDDNEKAAEWLEKAISYENKNPLIEYSIYALAELNEKNSNFSDAIKYYDQLLSYYPESILGPVAQFRIGHCYYMMGQFDNSVLELSDPMIEKLDAENKREAGLLLANAFFNLKEYESADNTFRKMLSSSPDVETADQLRYGLGQINFKRAKYEEAFNIFNNLTSSENDTIAQNSYFMACESRRMSGDKKSAALLYHSFLEKYPNSELAENARINLGLIYRDENDMKKSERYLITAYDSEKSKTKAAALVLLGEMALQKNDIVSAEVYFDSVLVIQRLDEDIRNRAELGKAISLFFRNKMNDSKDLLMNLELRNYNPSNVNFYLGEIYFYEKKYNDALRYYNSVEIKDEKTESDVLYGKAYCYFNVKDYANSMFYFNEFLKKSSRDRRRTDVLIRLADSYYALKNFSQAASKYAEVMKTAKNRKDIDNIHYQYAQALFNEGNYNAAIKEFNNIQKLYTHSRYLDESQYFIGWIYFKKGDFEQAITNYKTLLANFGSGAIVPLANYSIGDSYFNLGLYDSSIVYYKKILDKYPTSNYLFDAVNGIQYSYLSKNEPDQAIKLLDEFISSNKNYAFTEQIVFKKSEILYNSGKYADAIINLNSFVKEYPKSKLLSDAYYWMGKSYQESGENEEALQNFNYVADNYLGSDLGISSVIEAGKIYTADSNYSEALNIYDKVTDKMPLDDKAAEIYYRKALIFIEMNDLNGAYENLNKLIMYYDGNIFADRAKIELGIIELARGNYQNAEDLFKEVGEKKLDDVGAEAQFYYGVTLQEQQKLDEAISAFVRVRSVFSSYDEWFTKSLLKLGECYHAQEENAKARDMYRSVITRHKNDEFGKEAAEKLKELK